MLLSSAVWGQEGLAGELDVTQASKLLNGLEKDLKKFRGSDVGALNEWLKQVAPLRAAARQCIDTAEAGEAKIDKDLASLGEPQQTEPPEVVRKRKSLAREKDLLEKGLASCKLLLLRSQDLAASIETVKSHILAQQLMSQGPDALEVIRASLQQPAVFYHSTIDFITRHSGLKVLSLKMVAILLAGLLLGLAASLAVRRYLALFLQRHTWQDSLSSHFLRAVIATGRRYVPHILLTSILALIMFQRTHGSDTIPFVAVATYGLPLYFTLIFVIHLFLAPCKPAAVYLAIPEQIARRLANRLKMLVLLAYIGYLLFATLLHQSLPEHIVLLVRLVFVVFFLLNLSWAIWLIGSLPRLRGTRSIRLILLAVLLCSLVAELMGYRNLSLFMVRATLGTLLVVGLTLLFNRMFIELLDGFDQGRGAWQRKIRSRLDLKPGQRVPGLIWLRLTLSIMLWSLSAFFILKVWNISDAVMQQIYLYVTEGFTVGSLHVVPTKILFAILLFVALLYVSNWMKQRFDRNWLSRTGMERGAREAMTTMLGYLGTAIALLIALSVGGLDLSNLAIIAGALSVGIGFGLQNIVNNFVSGLILLFERPIRTGDWIAVGQTEGYVQRISIRSTTIKTFDRADVIVPNSDLISGQVTNWMLREQSGRLRIPISVAYGSDTALVKQLLLDIASQYADVITNGWQPEPYVLFMAFGESSLDFELRCFITNIDRRLRVISDLNFAIDAAFREHRIEIPFPQRDIHVRDLPSEASSGSEATP
ncbi:MAG: mechanosensitive ion channel family protein [Gammaproteobacteria bacterium]